MGAGAAPIPKSGKCRVFVLMGQSNMAGAARAKNLKRPYIAAVVAAQNRAGRELKNVATLYPGKLPVLDDGIHFNAEGQIMLGKFTASAIEEFYKARQ